MRYARNLMACVLTLSALSLVSLTSRNAIGQDAEGEGELEKQVNVKNDALPDIEERTIVNGAEPELVPILAGIEATIFEAYKARGQGDATQANSLFSSAYGALLSARSSYHEKRLGLAEPMVRDRNNVRMRVGDLTYAETWRPLLDYFNYRLSQFPRSFQDAVASTQDIPARQAYEQALRAGDAERIRQIAREYFYTDAGLAAFDRVTATSFESGDALDVVSQLMMLKETRPVRYASSPLRHLRLLLALEMIDDQDLLASEREWATANLKDARVSVGEATLPFAEAYQAARRAHGLPQPPASYSLPDSQGIEISSKQAVIGLQTRSQLKPQEVQESYNYYWSYRPQPTVMFREAHVGSAGIFVSRDKDSLLWMPAKSISPRRLKANAAKRYRDFEVAVEEEDNRRGWNRYQSVDPEPKYHLLAGQSGSFFPSALPTSNTPAQRMNIAAATFGVGTGGRRKLVGNQIQLLDMARDGKLMATLPLFEDAGVRVDSPTDEQLSVARTHFSGALTIRGRELYAIGSSTLPTSTEAYLYCFNLDPSAAALGKLIWRVKLAAKRGTLRAWETDYAQPIEAAPAHFDGRRAFIATNTGTLACVDVKSGRMLWTVKYSLGTQSTDTGYYYQPRESRNRIFPSAPAMTGSVLVAAPQDGLCAFSINAYDGHVLKPIASQRGLYEDHTFFLGAVDGYAYFQRDGGVVAYPVSYRSLVRDLADERGYTTGVKLETKGVPTEHSVAFAKGRGLICQEEILLPSAAGVVRLSRKDLSFKGLIRWPDVPELPKAPKSSAKLEVKREYEKMRREWGEASQAWVPGYTCLQWVSENESFDGKPAFIRTNAYQACLYGIERKE